MKGAGERAVRKAAAEAGKRTGDSLQIFIDFSCLFLTRQFSHCHCGSFTCQTIVSSWPDKMGCILKLKAGSRMIFCINAETGCHCDDL